MIDHTDFSMFENFPNKYVDINNYIFIHLSIYLWI